MREHSWRCLQGSSKSFSSSSLKKPDRGLADVVAEFAAVRQHQGMAVLCAVSGDRQHLMATSTTLSDTQSRVRASAVAALLAATRLARDGRQRQQAPAFRTVMASTVAVTAGSCLHHAPGDARQVQLLNTVSASGRLQ